MSAVAQYVMLPVLILQYLVRYLLKVDCPRNSSSLFLVRRFFELALKHPLLILHHRHFKFLYLFNTMDHSRSHESGSALCDLFSHLWKL